MPLSRRTLLATGCAAPLATLLPGPHDALAATPPDLGRRSRFLPLLGTACLLRDARGTYPAVLAAVRDLPGGQDGERCFALEFALRDTARPGQATFEVLHPGLPGFAALAAPSTADGDRLVAVFNNPR